MGDYLRTRVLRPQSIRLAVIAVLPDQARLGGDRQRTMLRYGVAEKIHATSSCTDNNDRLGEEFVVRSNHVLIFSVVRWDKCATRGTAILCWLTEPGLQLVLFGFSG